MPLLRASRLRAAIGALALPLALSPALGAGCADVEDPVPPAPLAISGGGATVTFTLDPFSLRITGKDGASLLETATAGIGLVMDERRRLAFLEDVTRQVYQLCDQAEAWAAIAALADELLAHETLEREQVLEVLSVWMR